MVTISGTPRLSSTLIAGLHAIRDLREVKVYVGQDGKGVVSPVRLYDKPVDRPTYRTIVALEGKDLIEVYFEDTSLIGSVYKYYRLTAEGRAALEEK